MRPALITTSSASPRAAEAAARLPVGGFEKLSTVDWPGQLAAVVFCQGCAWRCGYCHNPHLLPFGCGDLALAWDEIVAWLVRRRGLLDAVVFSGGEPTWHGALGDAMRQARALGFKIGLHTGGPSPWRLERLLPLLDWIGFDFKAPFADYAKVVGRPDGEAARRSLELVMAARIPCEIRTTWHPRLLSDDDLRAMADTLAALGRADWVIQRFRTDGCADAALNVHPVGQPPVALLARPGLRIAVR